MHFADRPKIVQSFDPTCPQHWPDLGSTSASKAPTWTHLAPTSAPPVRPNLRPRTAKFDPSQLFWAKYIRPASFFSVLFFGCGHTRKSIVNPVATPRRPPPALPSWHSWHAARRSWRLGVEPGEIGEGPLMGSLGKYRTMFH